jgi:putative redox protein
MDVRFPGSGGAELSARLDSPAAEARATALFAHCFTCSKDSKAAAYISRALAARGIATLRFDFSSLEFSANIDDLTAAAVWLRTNHAAPRILAGHSLGGAAVLAAAATIPEARAIATIGSPFAPAHVAHLVSNAERGAQAGDDVPVTIGGRLFRLKKQFFEDLERQDAGATIGALRKPLLVFHSPLDTVVDIENATRIFMAAKHPKSFVSLDRADHLLTRAEDAEYVAEVLAAWASRYLNPGAAARRAGTP